LQRPWDEPTRTCIPSKRRWRGVTTSATRRRGRWIRGC
jgi:hypothetical protein